MSQSAGVALLTEAGGPYQGSNHDQQRIFLREGRKALFEILLLVAEDSPDFESQFGELPQSPGNELEVTKRRSRQSINPSRDKRNLRQYNLTFSFEAFSDWEASLFSIAVTCEEKTSPSS
ncbi:MAG TPA: hypothetical protein DCE41_19405 [Cytophagales bacterium]|nr:hypothetical protein [Cytophagales bacterium]